MMMLYLYIHNIEDYSISVITDQKQKIPPSGNQIIIFLKDEHYRVAVYRNDREELAYFDPYGARYPQDFEKDLPQLREFAR